MTNPTAEMPKPHLDAWGVLAGRYRGRALAAAVVHLAERGTVRTLCGRFSLADCTEETSVAFEANPCPKCAALAEVRP